MQKSFSDLDYASKKKQTRRDRFLAQIEAVTPWEILDKTIAPFYPNRGGRGRLPMGLGRMLRMYVAQPCFGLSDEGIEDALYDNQAIRRFVGIDLGRESAPNATTLLNFRHLLTKYQRTESIFNAINGHLAEKGLFLREGTMVDATLIAAPPSTKNEAGKRDPDMHQSKKGNPWYFGMKAPMGVDAHTGLVHTVMGTAGNVSDISQAQTLLQGEEQAAFGDAGYPGVEKRPESAGASVEWHVAEKRSKVKALAGKALGDLVVPLEHAKASIRSKVEHPFHVVKNLFQHRKTRYKGRVKNTAQWLTLFGLVNQVLSRRWLLTTDGKVAS